MLREIRDQFNASLHHKDWMDPVTRNRAVEKLRKMFLGGTTKEGEYSPGAIRKLRSHEGRRLPYDVAALVFSFWMPPGGY